MLIVGGGPVGLALAVELGWRGIACELIEQTDGTIVSPKMNEVNARSMEFCRRWGIADKVFNCPFPADHPLDVAFVTSLAGYELSRAAAPGAQQPAAGAREPAPDAGLLADLVRSDPAGIRAARFRACALRHRCRLDAFEQIGRRRDRADRRPCDRAARGHRGGLSGRLRRRRQHGAARARYRTGGAGDHRPPDQPVLPRARADRALRQAARHVLPRHRSKPGCGAACASSIPPTACGG